MFGHVFSSFLSTGDAMLVQPMTPRFQDLFLPQAQSKFMNIQAPVFHMQTILSGFVREYGDNCLLECDRTMLDTAKRIGIFTDEELAKLDTLGDKVTKVVYMHEKYHGKTIKEKLVLILCMRLKEDMGNVKVFSKKARTTYGIDIVKRYVETNINCLIEEIPREIFRKEDVTFQQIHALMARRGGVETQRLLRAAKEESS